MTYPHWLTIAVTAAGAPAPGGDADTGEWAEGAADPVYDGEADVQDVGESVVYGQDKTTDESDAVAFLGDEGAIENIAIGMTARIVVE